MIRTILKPTTRDLTIQLPENFIGKMVEVIAFEIDEKYNGEKDGSKKDKISRLKKELAKFSFNSGGFNFDRDEANDYD